MPPKAIYIRTDKMLVTFEGIDCVGKTTAITVIREFLENRGFTVKTESDWSFPENAELREILLSGNSDTQILAALLARNRNMSSLKNDIKTFDVVLHDRYVLSTVVYQDVLEKYRNLLGIIDSLTVPHDLFYIRPTETFAREKTLRDRNKSDRLDVSPKQQYWLGQYEEILSSVDLSQKTGTVNIFTHESVYITENDGTQRFFESLRENAERIAEKLRNTVL